MHALCVITVATLFATSALTATTETAEGELAGWYYAVQSLTYSGHEIEGLSSYTSCEHERPFVAISTSGQSKHNGIALCIQFASGPPRLAIPMRLEAFDMKTYAVGDVKSRACFYTLLHIGTPITVKVTGVDPQPLQLL